ncbi:MAG: M20 family metallo-hydrolase [Gammaproteobacteria bacterium]|nr:M20 family metallo-hydrolase [Gammaproteobacteria bacterium]
MQRLDVIAGYSKAGPGVSRFPFTAEHEGALTLLREWMTKAGLEVSLDDSGTLIGRREGSETSRTLLLGSHQDSVPQGGKYDGIFGIVLSITCLEYLKHQQLPYAIEVLAFADEEGVRFPTALMGPRALAGTFDPDVLGMQDKDGVTLTDALQNFGLEAENIVALKRNSDDILGFIETHIEQGPVLESKGAPVGIVTAICGIERWMVKITGRAAHAGTTPMDLRYDALAAAAELISYVENLCLETEALVGVVGWLNVVPNAVNAVPGEVDLSIELRSSTDQVRVNAGLGLKAFLQQLADRRGLTASSERTYSQSAVQCGGELSDRLEEAAKAIGLKAPRLMSGATHDASAMSDLSRVAMLFVRCLNGVSHHGDESITSEDAGIAADVLIRFLEGFE